MELFFNSLWLLDFFINLNRVDFIRKIVTFKDTSYAYLRKTMIPDSIALIGSTTACIMGKMVIAKYFDIIRLIRFRKVLYPIDLFVEYYSSSGQKRISQIQQLIFVFFAFLMIGHLSACVWIAFGKADEYEPERKTWLFVNDFNGMTED